MNYFITGGTGFIGTHLSSLLHEVHPETRIYNLDIVEPGTPLPTVKNYKPALGNGEEHAATFIYCDVRQPIELEKVNITPDDVIFNFAAVHRTPVIPILHILKQISVVRRTSVPLPNGMASGK